MKDGLRLTPMEVYFLAKCMKAKYLDYSYFAAVPGMQKNYVLHEQEILENLEEREIIEEDFSGNTEVEEDVMALMEPVFFGPVESRLTGKKTYNIHIYNRMMTMAEQDGDAITFYRTDEKALKGLLAGAAVTVSCSKVGTGCLEETFTAADLKNKASYERAMKILKGEC